MNEKLALDPFGSLFADAWRIYKERFVTLIGTIAIPMAVVVAGLLMRGQGVAGAFAGVSLIVIGTLMAVIAAVALVLMIAKRTVGIGESYRQAMPLFWPALGMGILVGLTTIGGFVMLIVPGIMMGVWFIFGSFALVLEGKRGLGAMSRSREYARGYWWAIFGRYLLFTLLTTVVIAVVSAIVRGIAGNTVGTVMSYALSTLISPLQLTFLYGLYENIRRVKPALAADQSAPTTGRGFYITSAIIGLVAPLIIAIGVIASIVLLTKYQNNLIPYLSQTTTDTVVGQGSIVPLGASSTLLGDVSVLLPVGFQLDQLGPNQIDIWQKTSSSPMMLESSFITVAVGTTTPADYVAKAESSLGSPGVDYNKTTTTFLGLPATKFSLVSRVTNGSLVIFPANNLTFVVGINEVMAGTGSPDEALNSAIDGIVASLKIGK